MMEPESMRRFLLVCLLLFPLFLSAQQSGEKAFPHVVMHTTMGDIELEIRTDWAPMASENFLIHVKSGYYNGTVFHRIIRGFMIQGGDPTGTGYGGDSIWHRPFKNEYAPNVVFDRPGILAMANAHPDTNRSQFFITVAPAPWLNGGYTIFGRVVKGIDTVMKINRAATDSRHRPKDAIKVISADIILGKR